MKLAEVVVAAVVRSQLALLLVNCLACSGAYDLSLGMPLRSKKKK